MVGFNAVRCPSCRRFKAVASGTKTTTCSYCTKAYRLAKCRVYGSARTQAEIAHIVQALSEAAAPKDLVQETLELLEEGDAKEVDTMEGDTKEDDDGSRDIPLTEDDDLQPQYTPVDIPIENDIERERAKSPKMSPQRHVTELIAQMCKKGGSVPRKELEARLESEGVRKPSQLIALMLSDGYLYEFRKGHLKVT